MYATPDDDFAGCCCYRGDHSFHCSSHVPAGVASGHSQGVHICFGTASDQKTWLTVLPLNNHTIMRTPDPLTSAHVIRCGEALTGLLCTITGLLYFQCHSAVSGVCVWQQRQVCAEYHRHTTISSLLCCSADQFWKMPASGLASLCFAYCMHGVTVCWS